METAYWQFFVELPIYFMGGVTVNQLRARLLQSRYSSIEFGPPHTPLGLSVTDAFNF